VRWFSKMCFQLALRNAAVSPTNTARVCKARPFHLPFGKFLGKKEGNPEKREDRALDHATCAFDKGHICEQLGSPSFSKCSHVPSQC